MNDRATERLLELQDHLIAAIDLLTEEIAHAPDIFTVTEAARHIATIDSILRLDELRE